MAMSSPSTDDPGQSPDESPEKMSIPETPSPVMPRTRKQPVDMDASFDIAESIFCSRLPPPKIKSSSTNHEKTAKVKKKLVNKMTTNYVATETSSLQQNNVKAKSLNSKINNVHISASNSSVSSQSSGKNQQTSKSKKPSSSEESDEDIPLFRRIQRKKAEKRNEALRGFRNNIKMSLEKNHVKVENNVSACGKQTGGDPNNQMLLPKRDLPKVSVSHSKRVKLDSHGTLKDKHDAHNSRIKETKSKNYSTSESRSTVGRILEEPMRSSCMFANSDKSQVPKSSSESVASDSARHWQNSCAIASTSSRDPTLDSGPSSRVGKTKAKKKTSPPGNTVRNHTSNAIHRQIKDVFGSDSESGNEINEMGEQAYARHARRKLPPAPGLVAKVTKNKSRNNQILSDDSSDTEPDVSLLGARSKGKSKSSRVRRNEQKEDSSDTEPDVSLVPDRSKRKNISKRAINTGPNSDSSDTEPDVSLLGRRSKDKIMSRKAKEENRSRESGGNIDLDYSDVEMMSTSETPEKSPVFNRTSGLPQSSPSPVFQRSSGRRGVYRRLAPSSDPEPEVSRPPRVNRHKKKVRTDVDDSDSDVIPVEDEVELVPQRRRSPQLQPLVSEVISSHRIRISRGIRTDLGTEVNVDHLVRVTSTSDSNPQPRPSCQHVDPITPRQGRGHGIRGERIRTGRTPPSSDRRRRQLEADEQLARDLDSGKVRTPRSGRRLDTSIGPTGTSERRRRNRQVADDEALARELETGAISTPREEGASGQVDDDEAMARRLQEQFNAEALEEPEQPDMNSDTLAVHMPGQYPFTFHYEMGMSSSPHLRPYPNIPTLSTVNVSNMMQPIVFGDLDEEETDQPRTRRRTRATRSRGRRGGRRGRGNNSVHIQFFPMDDTLDDDYESLWELADRVGPAVNQGLTPEVLSLLPTFRYRPPTEGAGDQGAENQGKNCTICMMDYEEGDHLRRLPCFHDYHTACIDRWLADNSACPVCQNRVSVDDQAIG